MSPKVSPPAPSNGYGVKPSAMCSYSKQPQPGVGNSSSYGGKPSTANRKSRPITGPKAK